MAAGPQKIPLYSLNDLKSATDDALSPYLTSLPQPYRFRQAHTLTSVRLALGYSAVLIAGSLFFADYKLGWDATKAWTAPACALYFLINGALTLWVWKIEGGTVFVGVREGGQKLTLSSEVQKHKPIYKLRVKYESQAGKKAEDKTIEAPFHRWFSSDGYLQQPQLKEWLSSSIEQLGGPVSSDKKNIVAATAATTATGYNTMDLGETLVIGGSDLSDSAVGSAKTTRGRKGKKKA